MSSIQGIFEIIWNKRIIDFLDRLLYYGIIKYVDQSFYDGVKLAYKEVLKPYHSIVVSSLVALAFNLLPTREEFLKRLGFKDLTEAQSILIRFRQIVKPLVECIEKHLSLYDCRLEDELS